MFSLGSLGCRRGRVVATTGLTVSALVLTVAMVASPAQATVLPAATKATALVLSRPDPVSAAITARLQGSRVQIASLSTQTTSTWVNPDGTYTSDLNAQPVQAEVAPGNWKPLDGTLSTQADGTVAPAVSATGVSFAGGGSKAAARLGTYAAGD